LNFHFPLSDWWNGEAARAALHQHRDALNTFTDMQEQIAGVGVDLNKTAFMMGPKLTYSNASQCFTGEHSREANDYTRAACRKPFEIPEIEV